MTKRVLGFGTLLVISLLLPQLAARGSTVSPTERAVASNAEPNVHYVFDDEFTGSHLNLSKWQPDWLGTNNPISEENNCYNPGQVVVSGGYLHLKVAKRPCEGFPYVSGIVNTANTFHFTTGHLEVRVYLPATRSKKIANWPAVWTDGYGNWPSTGESDILEGITGQACWSYHGPRISDGSDGCATGAFTGWHTYGETVTRTTTTYFYDGRNVGHSANVDAQHFIVLNLAVPHSGPLRVPGGILVDYIRVTA